MARPRTFDRAEAVGQALDVIWARGYEATSIDDLCAATGLARSSLYEAFGSKHELLLAALEQYQDRAVVRIGTALERHRPIQLAVRRLLEGFIDSAQKEGPGRGCFLGNCASELGGLDTEATRLVARGLERIEDTVHHAFEAARGRGEIAQDADTRALARFLVSSIQGLRLVGKVTGDRRRLGDIVRVTVHALEGPQSSFPD